MDGEPECQEVVLIPAWKITMKDSSVRRRMDKRRVLVDSPHMGHKAGPELQEMFVKVFWR